MHIAHESVGVLSPYQTLVRVAHTLGNYPRQMSATVNYEDIRTGNDPAEAGKFMRLFPVSVEGIQYFLGTRATRWNERDTDSYLFAFPFRWEKVLAGRTREPRLMPIGADFPFFFTPNRAIITATAAGLAPANSGYFRGYIPVRELETTLRAAQLESGYNHHVVPSLVHLTRQALLHRTLPQKHINR